ncbi:hypothetical protein POVCU2_0026780 [Plasmodium ovale curtisi]|uniref:Uncharacterized protein n=1 Tax=Plasmodium ovale curtisi TaxID=864141 RepID=A0A1A8VXY8_PLAOA|nr:hypothetical protein POVCU2_0026780 [Plasmodium ovale curtisi]SBS92973.1 hypothetical protein POVCU1_024450 [Plasmodium ovale curtisi]
MKCSKVTTVALRNAIPSTMWSSEHVSSHLRTLGTTKILYKRNQNAKNMSSNGSCLKTFISIYTDMCLYTNLNFRSIKGSVVNSLITPLRDFLTEGNNSPCKRCILFEVLLLLCSYLLNLLKFI